MLPTIRLKCSNCQFRTSLRQGVPVLSAVIAEDEAGQPQALEQRVAGFQYDLFCWKCGRTTEYIQEFAQPLPGEAAWQTFQRLIERDEYRRPADCPACQGRYLTHPAALSRSVNLHELDRHTTATQENVWWMIHDQLTEFFNEVDHLFPLDGAPIPVLDGRIVEDERPLTERVFSTVLSIFQRRTLDSWASENARNRRKRFVEFFRVLPKEFRADFRLKHLYFMAQDSFPAQERLLVEIQHRVRVLEETNLLLQRETTLPEEISCPSCHTGYLLQHGAKLDSSVASTQDLR